MAKKNITDTAKKKFRITGFILFPLGIILFAVFIFSIFSMNFSLFFCGFIGIPLIAIGSWCLSMGYLQNYARYTSNQINPVVSEAIRYLVDENGEEIKDVIDGKIKCPNCHKTNDLDAKFCNDCGRELYAVCNKCQTVNDGDAKYCKKCGGDL